MSKCWCLTPLQALYDHDDISWYLFFICGVHRENYLPSPGNLTNLTWAWSELTNSVLTC